MGFRADVSAEIETLQREVNELRFEVAKSRAQAEESAKLAGEIITRLWPLYTLGPDQINEILDKIEEF